MTTKHEAFSIGDTARMAGVSQKQLRHWEARGYITPSMRIVCGQRAYRHFNMKQVEQIQGMKRLIDEGYAYSHFQFPGYSPMKIARTKFNGHLRGCPDICF